MEMEQVVKLLIAVVILVLMIWATIVLFGEKGGELIGGMRRLLRRGA